jgi:hypothetical protein
VARLAEVEGPVLVEGPGAGVVLAVAGRTGEGRVEEGLVEVAEAETAVGTVQLEEV